MKFVVYVVILSEHLNNVVVSSEDTDVSTIYCSWRIAISCHQRNGYGQNFVEAKLYTFARDLSKSSS